MAVKDDFANTAGGGMAAVFTMDEHVAFGLAYSLARYYPVPHMKSDQQVFQISRVGTFCNLTVENHELSLTLGMNI